MLMNVKFALAACLLLSVPGEQGKQGQQGGGEPPRAKQARPPQQPVNAPTLRPVQDPPRTSVERRDLLQRFAPASPLEGYYRLRSFTASGGTPVPANGYLAIGRRHLSIQMFSPRAGGPPAIRSAFRSYRATEGRLVMTTLLGLSNDDHGDVLIDQAGTMMTIDYKLIGTRLRLEVGAGRILEFERIE